MNLARSTYYYQIKNRKKALEREKEDTDLKELIDKIHTVFPYYGYRFLREELKRRGHDVNTKRIRRLQRKFGLFPVRYDNAAMESFMKTLKYNEIYLKNYDTLRDVLRHLPYFIEEVYNKKRLHSSLGYLTPLEFEARMNKMEEIGSPKLLSNL